ncbi:uncharacterized protein N7498_007864, partial [Penicillium cinerascens]
SPLSVISLSKLLDVPERLIHLRLNQLHSVLKVPDSEAVPVRLFHLSFRDFLLNPETRSKTPLGVNETEMHYRLARQCLLMCQNLRKNICRLPSDGTLRAEVDRRTVDAYIPPELQYACRYWAYHLDKCRYSSDMVYNALLFLQRQFLRKHFLHWVEAMSLLGLTSDMLSILDRLQIAISVYCAGLIFAPQSAIIRRDFRQELPTWICQFPRVEENWGAELQALEGHSIPVESVAFSRDGRLLVSGSGDMTVRVWDPATGALIQTLEGHSDSVHSVAFSPDGRLLASGSEDQTVRLWDPATRTLTQTLEDHSGSIRSVSFSPDGRLLASSSEDQTVRLWEIETGSLTQTLKGHSSLVEPVAFSSDGRRLASGSYDQTVRLWDAATGALIQILEGHSSWIDSVAFSPDGPRLWDTATGALTQTWNIENFFTTLEFSYDGIHLYTNFGALEIKSKFDISMSHPPRANLGISIEHGQWIKLNGERVLWLPVESRPRCLKTNGNTLAMGHTSGRISFFRFC